VFVFDPDTVSAIGVGLVSPGAELGMTPGTTVTLQLEAGAKEAMHVVEKVVPVGIGVAEGDTLVAAFMPVLVIVMIRGVPVR
jgi:hypothetical protein